MGVVDDVRAFLQSEGLIDGSTGWESHPRYMPDDQDKVVAIFEDGGPAPDPVADAGIGADASQYSGAQIRVRDAEYQHDTAYAKAKTILDKLHAVPGGQAMGSGLYEGVFAATSEPIGPMYDDQRRPVYTVNVRCHSQVPAPT